MDPQLGRSLISPKPRVFSCVYFRVRPLVDRQVDDTLTTKRGLGGNPRARHGLTILKSKWNGYHIPRIWDLVSQLYKYQNQWQPANLH